MGFQIMRRPNAGATSLAAIVLGVLASGAPAFPQSNPACEGPSDQNGSVYIDPSLPAPNVTVSASSYAPQTNDRPAYVGGPLGTCSYTLTLPQGTPALLLTRSDYWLDPGLTSTYFFDWAAVVTPATGAQAYASTGSMLGSSLPQNPQWIPFWMRYIWVRVEFRAVSEYTHRFADTGLRRPNYGHRH
jgi:hypothetical protein